MRFLSTLLTVAMAVAAVVIAAPATNTALKISQITEPASKYNLTTAAESAGCPKATRYACGQYMLEDGTRQDFVSQVYKCIPRDQFVCNTFKYEPFHRTKPGQSGNMIAAKVDPGCTCIFYSSPCHDDQYHEVWSGWDGEPGQPPWSRPAYTDKHFTGWWCIESY